MQKSSRKEFLYTSAMLLGAAVAGKGVGNKKEKYPLAFSTLGCPDWSIQQIVDFAVQHGYTGIEVRGLKREMDLPKCPEFSKEKQSATLALMKEKKLEFVGLGSSCKLHFTEGEEREKNLAEGKAYIDLAAEISCPNVRVFPNLLPKDSDKDQTMELISKGLLALGGYAKTKGVMVLMETHGDVVWTH